MNRPILISLALLLIVGAGTVSVLVLREHRAPELGPRPSPTASPAPTSAPSKAPPRAKGGIIRGSASYPAGEAPADLQVCAAPVRGGGVTCANVFRGTGFLYGLGYELRLAPGSYRVYSVSRSANPNFRGYYTRGVLCERQFAGRPDYEPSRCTDRTILEVSVARGGTVEQIDAVDYYGDFN